MGWTTRREWALRVFIAFIAAVSLVFGLAACTSGTRVVEGSSVTVAVPEAFTSLNPNTGFGSANATNESVVAATNSAFVSYDETPELELDESFGSYELLSEEPLAVRYTIADGVEWSDGVPVDAADLLLAWAANSAALNDEIDVSEFIDEESGRFTDDFPEDAVYFDGFSANGLQEVSELPEIGDDGRSLTLVFDEFVTDWELLFNVGLPAHVVAEQVFGGEDAQGAKDALVDAIEGDDRQELAELSRVWNSSFNLSETPEDEALLVSNGPYTVTAIGADGRVTLTANDNYRGAHRPSFASVELVYIADPLEVVGALSDGAIDVAGPQSSVDVVEALEQAEGIEIGYSSDGSFELLEIEQQGGLNGSLDDPLVRRAFLHVVPRNEMVDELLEPVQPEAEPRRSQLFMPGEEGYREASQGAAARDYRAVDTKAAKELLSEASAADPAAEHPRICVLFDPANPRRVSEFALLKSSAEQAGFVVESCENSEWKELLGTPGSYDVALYGLGVRNLSAASIDARLRTGSEINYAHYSDPEVDEALDSLMAGADADAALETKLDIESRLWEDGYGMPLYQFPQITGVNERVAGVVRAPFAPTVLWRPWEWSPAEEQSAG